MTDEAVALDATAIPFGWSTAERNAMRNREGSPYSC